MKFFILFNKTRSYFFFAAMESLGKSDHVCDFSPVSRNMAKAQEKGSSSRRVQRRVFNLVIKYAECRTQGHSYNDSRGRSDVNSSENFPGLVTDQVSDEWGPKISSSQHPSLIKKSLAATRAVHRRASRRREKKKVKKRARRACQWLIIFYAHKSQKM